MKKKSRDFTKSGEILFFPNQDQTNPFSIVGGGGGELSCYLNITLLYMWSLL